MIGLRFEDADKAVKAMLDTLGGLTPRTNAACSKAINATLREMRTLLLREAKSAYTVNTAAFDRKIEFEYASARRLYGHLCLSGKRSPGLINYQARPARPVKAYAKRPKQGVSVKVLRGGSRKHPRHEGQKVFAVTFKESGNTHLVVRLGKRLLTRYGPHPIQALRNKERQRMLREEAVEKMSRNLQRELDLVLDKLGRKH